ncbi:MAG: GGDEF domain-containing protein, partial [Planctomycetales bacterium]|nr:GGDEF domain-containing protein [Planctomycetales bacterium]
MVELLCTLTGIIAGVAVVASLFHQQGERQKFAAAEESNASDRILGIADQLQVISHRVAANVTAHSEKVVHISDRLSVPNKELTQVLSTINEIITANQAMQGQLADAQMRIAQQSRLIEQASHQARTDALTGLANRRALNEFISNSIENATDATCMGLLLMDIDHFKSFND